MSIPSVLKQLVMAVSMAGVASTALAFDTPAGTIGTVYVSGETNEAFRIYLNGVTKPCAGSVASWAYIQAADSNYKVYVATLLLAKVQGSSVSLVAQTEANGLCHIIEFSTN